MPFTFNQQEAFRTELNILSADNKIPSKDSFDKSITIGVSQNEFAIVNAHSKTPIAGSINASSCSILAIYNSKTQTVAVSHLNISTDLNSLKNLINLLATPNFTKPAILEAYLVTGDEMSFELCANIIKILKENMIKICYIESKDSMYGDTASLAFDARTGNFFVDVTSDQLIFGENAQERGLNIAEMMQLGKSKIPLNKIYDDRPAVKPLDNSYSPTTFKPASQTVQTNKSLYGELYKSINADNKNINRLDKK